MVPATRSPATGRGAAHRARPPDAKVTSMKTTALIGVLLLCSCSSFAQGFRSGGGGLSGGGSWNGGGWGCGWCNSGLYATSPFAFGSSGVRYEPPATFAVGYATNDGDYVPSVYMDYQDALELGKRQLAEMQQANEHPVSLGEIARALRSVKQPDSRVPRSNSPKRQFIPPPRPPSVGSPPRASNADTSLPQNPSITQSGPPAALAQTPTAVRSDKTSANPSVRLAVVQDDSGRLQVCDRSTGNCHYPI